MAYLSLRQYFLILVISWGTSFFFSKDRCFTVNLQTQQRSTAHVSCNNEFWNILIYMSLNKLSFLYIPVKKINWSLEQLRFLKSDMQVVFPMGALGSSSKNITLWGGPLAVILKNKTVQKMTITAILVS